MAVVRIATFSCFSARHLIDIPNDDLLLRKCDFNAFSFYIYIYEYFISYKIAVVSFIDAVNSLTSLA